MTLRYDTEVGSVDVSVVFFHALADPTTTSALRQAAVSVELGDAYGGDDIGPGCGRGRDGLAVEANLGNSKPPIVGYDLFDLLNPGREDL